MDDSPERRALKFAAVVLMTGKRQSRLDKDHNSETLRRSEMLLGGCIYHTLKAGRSELSVLTGQARSFSHMISGVPFCDGEKAGEYSGLITETRFECMKQEFASVAVLYSGQVQALEVDSWLK